MIGFRIAVVLLLFLRPAGSAVADPHASVPDSATAVPDPVAARALLLTGAAAPLPTRSFDLTFTADAPRLQAIPGLLHPHRIDLNRGETALQGMGLVANHVGFLAAIGSAAGLMDEKTALKVIAAGAAAGALWGASLGSGNAMINTRIVYTPDRPFDEP